MMCTNPVVLETGFFNCGKCQSCQAKVRQDWEIRLTNELKTSKTGICITLTYRNDCLPPGATLVKSDVQNYIKRIRQQLWRNRDNRRIKYFVAGEYGDRFGRPHYHAIIFGLSMRDQHLLHDKWQMGFTKVDILSPQSIRYVTKYLQKPSIFRGRAGRNLYRYQMHKEPPFRLMSQGIGLTWFLENIIDCMRDKCVKWFDKIRALPKSYRRALMLTQDDYPHLKIRQQAWLAQFFDINLLTPAERLQYDKYGVDNWLQYKHLRENVKNYFKALDNHQKLLYYEYT